MKTILNDINHITIKENSDGEVYISPNWFVTAVAISHVQQSLRYISYADNLSAEGNINVMYSHI